MSQVLKLASRVLHRSGYQYTSVEAVEGSDAIALLGVTKTLVNGRVINPSPATIYRMTLEANALFIENGIVDFKAVPNVDHGVQRVVGRDGRFATAFRIVKGAPTVRKLQRQPKVAAAPAVVCDITPQNVDQKLGETIYGSAAV